MKIGDTRFVIVNNETRELVPFDGDTTHFDTDRKSCEDVMHEIDAAETSSVVECVFVESSEVARLRKCEAVLRRVEWAGDVYDRDNSFDICPCCRAEKCDGHKPDCELAASLTPSGDGETEK